MDELEANLAEVARFLRFNPAGVAVEYYKYRDTDDVRANGPCPNGWHSCTNQSMIHTGAQQAMQHELLHAYAASVGYPSNVYQEGLAEMFNCTAMAGPDPPGVSWQDVAAVASGSEQPEHGGIGTNAYYVAATFFVRHLVDRFGAGAFMAFYASGSTNRSSVEQFGTEFEAAFGVPIDGVWADAHAGLPDFGWPYLCLCGQPAALGQTRVFD